ncbi:TetR/AcrR family transcriptional regulator [Lysinibacillus sp. BW-2-10]|uniref:TetR/AcrR family transcriptional regulator n=1 Tax=Lysinibacillus sp. BW-2-10 TaxID=2590030 RepID=UPI00117FCD79|nr:TetR/AcrR family transcriptional regulator [Lysinibacillus sp. BW-2-10]TSI04507.1 TetR/AcrR family transcriptional regulator [Lysinibacillus sp. BW-2-10]
MNKRKRQIIHAARQLFIDKGFNDTSIMDIISAAHISKGTFYNHFASKNECLIAILEETREEALSQRYEIAINEDRSNIDILIKQIALIAYVNRKRNVVQIFESLAGNADKELKALLEKHIILEISWLANRLVDVYGEKIRDISFECAVHIIGMMQQSLRIIAMATKQFGSPEEVIKVVMNHIDAIIERQLIKKEIIITPEIVQSLQLKVDLRIVSKEMLVNQLEGFKEKLTENDPESGIEYTDYLIKELQSNNDSLYILEAILQAFIKSFKSTTHEHEVHEISIAFWRYLHMKKENL